MGCNYSKFLKIWKWFWNRITKRWWNNFQVHIRKSWYCCERTAKTILVRAEKKKCRGSIYLLRKYINHEQNGGRNMDSKGHSDETSGRNEENVIAQWRKGNPCQKVAKNLAKLCLFHTVFVRYMFQLMILDIYLRFRSNVLKEHFSCFWFLIVKCEKREMN